MFATLQRLALPSARVLVATLSAFVALAGCGRGSDVPKWGLFEAAFASTAPSGNPLQDRELLVTFTSPTKRAVTVRGFWDGGDVWRVRFSPDETGEWNYATRALPEGDSGLHGRMGRFRVTDSDDETRFDEHGPVRVSASGTFLEHADGTPFFWLADTGWNAALKATPDEWEDYIEARANQGFTAIQWVTTQWRAAPTGDRVNEPAFTGRDRIEVNTAFFQRLDARVAALDRTGLLNVPVLLWAIGGGADPDVNPGHSLPEDQAIRLAQYMIARWQGYNSVWILAGDGDYRGARAERWKRIGRGVFDDRPHAPAVMHPGGMHWILREFLDEPWVDIHGYQSGHGDDERTLRWMTDGPPATDWPTEPVRPFINLEPPYENHVAYQSKQPISAATVRRAVYWSLLNAPTAGVSYGGHGVWGWDDGSGPPTDHAGSGTPLPWREAIEMPGATQMKYVADLFTAIDYWRLRPAQDLLVEQPGVANVSHFIVVAATAERDLLVAYTPAAAAIALKSDVVTARVAAWFNPRTGERRAAEGAAERGVTRFTAPDAEDWVLVVSTKALAEP
jgi:hypothetical protein